MGLLTLFVLILNIPDRLDSVLGLWLLFAALTALALNLGVLLTSSEISAAHVFAIMAFLTLGHGGAASEAIWAVAVGALVGGLIQAARAEEWLPRRRVTVRSLGTMAEIMAQLTLSLLVGATLYIHLGGRLPLGSMVPGDALPLLALTAGYVGFYLLFLALRIRLEGESVYAVWKADALTLAGVVVLPVPFGILGAVVATDLDNLSWTILISGVILVVIGVYGLSRTQFYYRQQVQELSSLSVVSQALRTNLQLHSLLETIYLQVAHLLNVDHFTVALLDSLSHQISFPLAIRRGSPVELPPRPPGEELLDHVINQRAPLLVARDVSLEARRLGLQPPSGPVYSWLGVPLLAPDRVLGAIAVASGDPEHLLSAADQRLLMNIAAQAGIAIENAQLYGQAQDRALQLGTLNSISALLTGTLSPEKVINLITSSVVAVANCDAVAVYVYGDDGLTLVRNIGLSEAFSQHPPEPLIARQSSGLDPARLGRQPVVVADSHHDPQVSDEHRALLDREGKHAWIELMLVAGDTPLGVITAYFNQARAFSGEEIELMRAFAVQA
ncbi:MAG: GAF domain-containing protein, partial [Rubrivivax sp.]|nr:GAF domain-containing protein [Rubrivivax sp.]